MNESKIDTPNTNDQKNLQLTQNIVFHVHCTEIRMHLSKVQIYIIIYAAALINSVYLFIFEAIDMSANLSPIETTMPPIIAGSTL